MIFVPSKHLRQGMLIGRSVTVGNSKIPLLISGQRLDEEKIFRLLQRNIDGIYIETKLCNDISVENFISPEFKQEMCTDLKIVYSGYLNNAASSKKIDKTMVDLAAKLMDFVLSKDECLLNVVEIKDYDNYTFSHSIYVGTLAVLIGIQLGCSDKVLTELAMAGLMHDVGKLDVPISIVNKPAALTNLEFEEMKKHPEYAVKRLEGSPAIPQPVLAGIESHHEKFNGTGYPKGISGSAIPLYGRILALADVYDALTSARSYRRAWRPHEAVEYILGNANSHFDYTVLQAFLRTVAPYPVGTMVELSNGVMGIVAKINRDNILRPIVQLINEDSSEGARVNLSSDFDYLSVTIVGAVGNDKELPAKMFE